MCSEHWRACNPVLRRALLQNHPATERGRMVRVLALASVSLRTRADFEVAQYIAKEFCKLELDLADRAYGAALLVRMSRSKARGL